MSLDTSPENTSQDGSENKAAQITSLHLYFPCGIIRGALSNLGIPCAVSADISNLPACKLRPFFLNLFIIVIFFLFFFQTRSFGSSYCIVVCLEFSGNVKKSSPQTEYPSLIRKSFSSIATEMISIR